MLKRRRRDAGPLCGVQRRGRCPHGSVGGGRGGRSHERRTAFSFQPYSPVNATANPVTNARVPILPPGLRLGFIVVFMTVSGKDYLVLRGHMHITLTDPGSTYKRWTPRPRASWMRGGIWYIYKYLSGSAHSTVPPASRHPNKGHSQCLPTTP